MIDNAIVNDLLKEVQHLDEQMNASALGSRSAYQHCRDRLLDLLESYANSTENMGDTILKRIKKIRGY